MSESPTCPTCGSTDPSNIRHRHIIGGSWGGENCASPSPRIYCDDAFHDTKPRVADWESAHACVKEALRITAADRNKAYASPEDNFARIALCWTALLDEKLTEPITAADTARCMTALKLVRDAHAPHRDNRVDGIGYLLCLERTEPTDG